MNWRLLLICLLKGFPLFFIVGSLILIAANEACGLFWAGSFCDAVLLGVGR
jgi:hypothetical protein